MRSAHPIIGILVFAIVVVVGFIAGYSLAGRTEDRSSATVVMEPDEFRQNVPPPPIDPQYQPIQGLIQELRAHDIVVFTSWREGEVGRPLQVQVLAGAVRDGYVRIGDKELSLDEAREELAAIREMLKRDLEFTYDFVLVMDTRKDREELASADEISRSWDQLSELARDMDLHMTICGIENFEHDGPPTDFVGF